MRHLVIIFIFVFSAQTIFAQKAIIKEISEISPFSKMKYVFPQIIIPGNKTAENKINKKLQEDILDMGPPGYQKSIFEDIWELEGESDGRWVFINFSYEIFSSTDQYLCLSISFTGGKYDQDQTYMFVFDTFTGEVVELKKLLNPKGKKWLIEAISVGRTKRVIKEMTVLKDSMQRHKL
ncbi:MAG: hypothetical protein JWQ30_1774, partial [Sediminibacterium sp.]|nr:hypothetical protein [Sediminibacterium sp.]